MKSYESCPEMIATIQNVNLYIMRANKFVVLPMEDNFVRQIYAIVLLPLVLENENNFFRIWIILAEKRSRK